MHTKIIPSLHQLNWHTLQYAIFTAALVEKNIRRKKIRRKSNPYPACVACVESELCGNLSYGYTGKYALNPAAFFQPLRGFIEYNLGQIGGISGRCKNIIGKCAEACAINSLMYDCIHCKSKLCVNQMQRGIDIRIDMLMGHKYILSEAYRPRTLEWIKRCDNCQIF